VVFCSLILQQCGRAYIADRLGDHTPRLTGRVTLNPVPHIDPLGTIIVPLAASFGLLGPLPFIGWAKALQMNPSNFNRGKFDHGIVILAGPGLFFMFALMGTIGAAIVARAGLPVVDLFGLIIRLNVALGVFNLLPIPPIEFSKFFVLSGLMSEESHAKASFIGSFVLLFLLMAVRPFQILIGTLIAYGMIPYAWLLELLL
jgi:Zn-dependent protease